MRKKKPLPNDWVDLSPIDYVNKWYDEHYAYISYCNTAGLGQQFMHQSIESSRDESCHFNRVLEIGANRGEHLEFVRHTFCEYFSTDIKSVDQSAQLPTETRAGIVYKQEDASKLSFPDSYFDRVLSSCVLHHVQNAESTLIELRRVLKTCGKADLFLSCDPGFLFRLGRYLGPVREAKKSGLDGVKRLLDARDHQNHVAGLTRLIRHVFRDDEIIERSYPIPFMSWNFSFWKIFKITKSN